MNILWNFVVVIQIVAALAMIGLVLIQHGKGADMGSSFGSGASGSLFGATGSATFLSRATAVCAGLFFACTLALAYFSVDRPHPASGGSVLDRPTSGAAAGAGAASSSASRPATGAAQVPTAAGGANVVPAPAAGASGVVSVPAPSQAVAPDGRPASSSGAGAVPTR